MTRKTGGSNDYYSADVVNTLDGRPSYTVQCLEVIETLGMTFAEGEAFKAIWRSCAARTLGKHKADNNARYDAEKVEFYGARMVAAASVGQNATGGPISAEPRTFRAGEQSSDIGEAIALRLCAACVNGKGEHRPGCVRGPQMVPCTFVVS